MRRALLSPTLALALIASLGACASTPASPTQEPPTRAPLGATEAPPTGRLPRDVRPSHYQLDLTIIPSEEGFSGRARIDVTLSEARSLIWLHARDLKVSAARVIAEGAPPVAATFEQVDEEGLAKLTPATPIGPGDLTLEIEYAAPFNRKLTGLYRVDRGDERYAFTQFESISARRAFPGFDEPAFKVPFDVSVTTTAGLVVAANTPITRVEPLDEGLERTRFSTTRPLPTYLLAWAVGPFDVVEPAPIPPNAVRHRPLPLRGIAAKGRGARLAYALAHTGAFVAALERYFGRPYPYAKLDLVAAVDFAPGGMENAGLILFRESLLLLDEGAPENQQRYHTGVLAHELAHMWFGDLVTMPWWDDIWLNEAFATWMGHKVVDLVYPRYRSDLHLLMSAEWAMSQDSLMSARRIRQPITSTDDIRNAFDGITYSKGGGVLSMTERWLGEEVFQRGIRAYIDAHADGIATAEDLLAALGQSAGRDVATPLRTFLDQPGLPFVEASLDCGGEHPTLRLSQSRYLPLGSTGDPARRWQIPLCVRYGRGDRLHETCTLLSRAEDSLALEGACPEWVLPNAGGAGYLRFSLPTEQLRALTSAGWPHLSTRERLALSDSLGAAFARGTLAAADYYALLPTFAKDPTREVAGRPMGALSFARRRLVEGAQLQRVRAMGRELYGPWLRELGWAPKANAAEEGDRALWRSSVVGFLALEVRDRRVRERAAALGLAYLGLGPHGDGALHPEALPPDLIGVALTVAAQEGDAARLDRLRERLFASDDALLRGKLLRALGSILDGELAGQIRDLTLDPRLRVSEVMRALGVQLEMDETREASWRWLQAHFDALVARVGPYRAGGLPNTLRSFCSAEASAEVERFFTAPVDRRGADGEIERIPRIETLAGGPRNLAGTLEAITLCAARVEAQRDSARRYFSR